MEYIQHSEIDKWGWKRFYLESKSGGSRIYHNIYGPAVELPDGTKYWYTYGNLNKIEYANGNVEIFYKNKLVDFIYFTPLPVQLSREDTVISYLQEKYNKFAKSGYIFENS